LVHEEGNKEAVTSLGSLIKHVNCLYRVSM